MVQFSLLLSLSLFLPLYCSSSSTNNATTTAKAEYLKLPLLHVHHKHHHPKNSSLLSPVVSGASSGAGQYFVSLRLGTPPQSLLLVADTGSDLVWVKCSACRSNDLRCPSAVSGASFFARHSLSFAPLHCYDSLCQQVPHPDPNPPCNRTRLHSPCRFEYSYSDGSISSGFFSTETATSNTSSHTETRIPGFTFGCGFHVSGPSLTGPSFNGSQGVMGLGRGPISFTTQMGRHFGNSFSYCLKDYTLSPPPTSFLIIGNHSKQDGDVSPRDLRFTPLIDNPQLPTFYYIGIENVYVNGVKLRMNSSVWSIDDFGNGGTIVDSGTTLTFLVEAAYRGVLAAMRRRVKLPSPVRLTPGFDLCVNVTGTSKPKLPRLSFKLAGGVVLSPPVRNYFIDTEKGVKCMAIQPVTQSGGFSVIGNVMQQGFWFEFDVDRSRLGFSRKGCGSP